MSTEMNESKTKSVTEIQTQISNVTAKQRSDSKEIDSLRNERAQLSLNGDSKKNVAEISACDHRIFKLETAVSNYPAELKLLEENLAAENQRLADVDSANLLEQQKEIAKDIQNLSQKFIETLKKANNTNILLRDALTAYNGLKEKTGQDVLEGYCDGSVDSLRMLLEKSEGELAGINTQIAGAGMVHSNVRIRL